MLEPAGLSADLERSLAGKKKKKPQKGGRDSERPGAEAEETTGCHLPIEPHAVTDMVLGGFPPPCPHRRLGHQFVARS